MQPSLEGPWCEFEAVPQKSYSRDTHPKKPNMGRSFTCGQPATSSTRAADQAFISSEILWSLGRARFMQGANYECQPLNAQLHLSFPRSAVTEADARHRGSIRYSPWRISALGYRIRQQP